MNIELCQKIIALTKELLEEKLPETIAFLRSFVNEKQINDGRIGKRSARIFGTMIGEQFSDGGVKTMVKFSRRRLLQAGGAALTACGVNRWQCDRYGKVLAQSTRRKLALLVGINQYSSATGPLYGCVNDAILQGNLLVHRFGFNPRDILILDDAKATRQGILDAFEEHLIKQAKPGDVAVFHYSGHGSLIHDPNPLYINRITGERLSGSLVPIDSDLPNNYDREGGTVNDIMGHTLFLLMSALQTENCTAVLDSCHAGASTRTSFRVRSRVGGNKIEARSQETRYQERWLRKFGWSPEEFVNRYRRGVAKGVVLASTQPEQLAIDEDLNGFVAGAFTYRFTQYLWQNNANAIDTIKSVAARMKSELNVDDPQQPLLEIEPGKPYGEKPLFFIDNPRSPARAVVLKKEGDRVTVLLGGIDPGSVNSGMRLIALEGGGRVTIEERQQFWAEGRSTGNIEVGTLLRVR